MGRLRSAIEGVRERSLQVLKDRARWVQKGSDWLETRSGLAHKVYLSASAVVFDPTSLARGFRVVHSDAESLVIKMPNFITNQSLDASLHAGSIVALGEFASRQLWMKTLDFSSCSLSLSEVHCRLFDSSSQEVEARLRLDVLEREQILLDLRKKRNLEVSLSIPMFGNDGQMVAEVDTLWVLKLGPLYLGQGQPEAE